jgi:hypothetical protein
MLFRGKAKAQKADASDISVEQRSAAPPASRAMDNEEVPHDISAALALVDVFSKGFESGLEGASKGKSLRLVMGSAELKIDPGKTGVDVNFQIPGQPHVKASDIESFMRLLRLVDTTGTAVIADLQSRRLVAVSGFSARTNAFGVKGDGADVASTLLNVLTQSRTAPFEYVVKESKAFKKFLALNGRWMPAAQLSASLAELGVNIDDGATLTRLAGLERLIGTASSERVNQLLRDIGVEAAAGRVSILPSPAAVNTADFSSVLARGEELLRSLRARFSGVARERTDLAAALFEISSLIDAAYREAALQEPSPRATGDNHVKLVDRVGAKDLFFVLRRLERFDLAKRTKSAEVASSTLNLGDMPSFPLNISLAMGVLESVPPATVAALVELKSGRDGHQVRIQTSLTPEEMIEAALSELVARIESETGVSTIFGQLG